MRTLTSLIIFLLTASQLTAEVDFPFPRVEPSPSFKGKPGRYSGIITVVERVPRTGAALLPDPPTGSFLESKASGRVTAAVIGGAYIRILGTPGSNLLGCLDAPSYAAITVETVTTTGQAVLGYVAKAQKGNGAASAQGNRVRLRFEIETTSDTAVMRTATVLIDLTRVGD